MSQMKVKSIFLLKVHAISSKREGRATIANAYYKRNRPAHLKALFFIADFVLRCFDQLQIRYTHSLLSMQVIVFIVTWRKI